MVRELEADPLDTRKFIYRIANNYRKVSTKVSVKGENGELLTNPTDTSKRWEEYLNLLLNAPTNIKSICFGEEI